MWKPRLNLRDSVTIYTVILAVVGGLLVFVVPPFQSPDEQTHLYRAYQLSEGHVLGKHLSYGAGDLLPASLSQSFDRYSYLLFNPDKKVTSRVFNDTVDAPLNSHQTVETRFENTAIYPPLAYLPQIIGVWVGRIFEVSPVLMLYLARLANVAAWVALIGLAMRRNRRVALPLFAFALLPITAFQAASASADVVTAGIAIFFTLEVFRLLSFTQPLTKRNLILLGGLSVALALCKFPYILLTLLVLGLSKKRLSGVLPAWQARLAVLGPAWLLALGWLAVAQHSFVNLRAGVDTAAQLHFIFSAPLGFAKALYMTYLAPSSDLLYIQMIGQLGWLDTKVPLWVLLCSLTAVVLAIVAMPVDAPKVRQLSGRLRGFAGIIFALLIGAISSLLYLTWNAPGAGFIDGLQGRYFTPLFGLLVFLGGGLLGLRLNQQRRATTIVYSLLGISTIGYVVVLLVRYYSF